MALLCTVALGVTIYGIVGQVACTSCRFCFFFLLIPSFQAFFIHGEDQRPSHSVRAASRWMSVTSP